MLSLDDITKNLPSLQFDSVLPDDERLETMLVLSLDVKISFKCVVFYVLGEV